jgi:hypothetical protein
MELIYVFATFHGLAKLHLHTDATLTYLDNATTALGQHIRWFEKITAASFATTELPREQASRGRREAARIAKGKTQRKHKNADIDDDPPKPKTFSLLTYKLHALGDYAKTIRWFGTTDSYSTQTVILFSWLRYKSNPLMTTDRENLNIGESNAFLPELTRTSSCGKLENWNGENDYFVE